MSRIKDSDGVEYHLEVVQTYCLSQLTVEYKLEYV